MPLQSRPLAILSLLTGAIVWGMIWYPYRVLADAGVSGALASLLSYGLAAILGLLVFLPQLKTMRYSVNLLLLALAAGCANIAYVLGVLHGEVMRVLLLFYLAPLWTIILARFLLHERITWQRILVIVIALAGAMVMLWRPESGLPVPKNTSEWLGLAAGGSFALANVFSRKTLTDTAEQKSIAIWFGVVVLASVYCLITQPVAILYQEIAHLQGETWLYLLLLGVILIAVGLVVQYGLTQLSATQSVVILLSELIFVAISAYYLADEVPNMQTWIGGVLIALASLASGESEE